MDVKRLAADNDDPTTSHKEQILATKLLASDDQILSTLLANDTAKLCAAYEHVLQLVNTLPPDVAPFARILVILGFTRFTRVISVKAERFLDDDKQDDDNP